MLLVVTENDLSIIPSHGIIFSIFRALHRQGAVCEEICAIQSPNFSPDQVVGQHLRGLHRVINNFRSELWLYHRYRGVYAEVRMDQGQFM
ncbi:hypothetical protein DSUL_50275 [Desulfovibrionales bacterium]